MASVYVSEPVTRGKVVLHTTLGDIDIEIWSKETPKACRNFLQLCMEGYYDDTIFHRIIPEFMIQGGDPTGTGTGGESVYGEPFLDEVHSRIRFNHRGQVAMASNGRNTNGSQFFITLDKCEWLDKKHTIFGKVTGDTIFNLLKCTDLETDKDDRPLYPPKIVSTEVLLCPFDDIVCRPSVKRAVASAATEKKKETAVKAVKNKSLLSFEEDGTEIDQEQAPVKKKAVLSSHDVLNDPKLLKEPVVIQSSAVSAGGGPSAKQNIAKDADSTKQKTLKQSVAVAASRVKQSSHNEDASSSEEEEGGGGGVTMAKGA